MDHLLDILINVSLLILDIEVSAWLEVPEFCLITALNTSILDCTSSKLTALLKVVVALLVPPVKVSPLVNVPLGIVIAIEVEEGLLVMLAVAELVPPVKVSPTNKLDDDNGCLEPLDIQF